MTKRLELGVLPLNMEKYRSLLENQYELEKIYKKNKNKYKLEKNREEKRRYKLSKLIINESSGI
jgi:hypothetical protein